MFDRLASKKAVEKTIESLEKRGVFVEFAESAKDALEKLTGLIPASAEVMTGSSTTLKQIGFTETLKSGKHPWKNLKEMAMKEKDSIKKADLQRKGLAAQYFIGSVHAVAQTGEVLIASATGSQLPSYAYSSPNVIWIVGTQKITANLNKAFKRVWEYALPLEDQRMKDAGESGSDIGKILLFEKEIFSDRKIILIFVNEKLGF